MKFCLLCLSIVWLIPIAFCTEKPSSEIRLRLAQDAMYIGMPLLAEQMACEGRLNSFEELQKYRLLLANACIAQQKLDDAAIHLNFISNIYNNANASLSLAILQVCKGQKNFVPFAVLRWSENAFNRDMLPWYLFLRATLLKLSSPLNACTTFFRSQTLLEPKVAQLLEILEYTAEIPTNFISLSLIPVQSCIEQSPPSTLGFQFAREYALETFERGEVLKALDFLDKKIKSLGDKNRDERIKFLLLKALFEKQAHKPTIDSVCEILSIGSSQLQSQQLALKILSSDEMFWKNQTYFNKVEDFFKTQALTPTTEFYWTIKGKFLLLNGQYDDAKAFMESQLPKFSTPSLKAHALYLLAYSAFLKNPPAYRLAADYIKEASTIAPEFWPLSLSINIRADILFLNQDYDLAKALYLEVLERDTSGQSLSDIAYQWILTSVLQNNLTEAKINLSKAIQNHWLIGEQKWQIEYALLEYLKKTSYVEALEYANSLSEEADTEEKKLLLACSKAELYLSQNKPQSTLEELNKLQPFPANINALWLKGKALGQLNEYGSACEQFEALRKLENINHSYHILSYIEEANLLTLQKAYAQAQQLLTEMADKFPQTLYAPIGLYLAATNAEQRGLLYANETVGLLNRLIERYPSHELVYFAKLKQGHLLMSLNNFSAAKQIFVQLQHDFPAHIQNTYCKYLEIKCQIAQSIENTGNEIGSLETLLSYPDIPLELKLEIVYQLSLLYGDQKQYPEAKKLLWKHIDKILELNGEMLNEKTAYWLSRCLFQLAEYSEKENAYREARKLYQLILKHKLPGSNVAEQKLTR